MKNFCVKNLKTLIERNKTSFETGKGVSDAILFYALKKCIEEQIDDFDTRNVVFEALNEIILREKYRTHNVISQAISKARKINYAKLNVFDYKGSTPLVECLVTVYFEGEDYYFRKIEETRTQARMSVIRDFLDFMPNAKKRDLDVSIETWNQDAHGHLNLTLL